jgi:hypothetical protein
MGKWVRHERQLVPGIHEVHSDDGDMIATVDTEANANLIAAAPDLLAALDLVDVRLGNARAALLRDNRVVRVELDSAIAITRAAIAKANGETNEA